MQLVINYNIIIRGGNKITEINFFNELKKLRKISLEETKESENNDFLGMEE